MPLILEKCTLDDIPAIVRISAAAFGKPSPINVFPDTPTVNAFRKKRAMHSFQHDPFLIFIKIVDTELPPDQHIIAFAKWAKPHTKEERAKSGFTDLLMTDELPAECNRQLIRDLEVVKDKQVKEVMGNRTFYHLDVLATHPDHGGKGCAGRLVKWGMQRADEEGIECYVEAQDTSKPIFVKYGWKEERDLVVQGEKRGTILVYTPGKNQD